MLARQESELELRTGQTNAVNENGCFDLEGEREALDRGEARITGRSFEATDLGRMEICGVT